MANFDLDTSMPLVGENYTIDETVQLTGNNLDDQGIPIMSTETTITNQDFLPLVNNNQEETATEEADLHTSTPASPQTECKY